MSSIATAPAPAAAARPHERDDALDGVRGLSLYMVLLIHLFLPAPGGGVIGGMRNIFQSMFIATDLFFMLSGFLITSILIRARGREGYFKSFYWRRALRIMPAYTLTLVFLFLLIPAFLLPAEQAAAVHKDAKWYVLYLQNFAIMLAGQPPPWLGMGHLWSVAVEEQFYLLWPVLVALMPPRLLPRFCIAVVMISIALKLMLWAQGANWVKLYIYTPCRLESLAAGGWIAARCAVRGDFSLPPWLRFVAAPATAALIVLMVMPHSFKLYAPTQVVAHNILATFAFAWMVYEILASRENSLIRRFFRQRPLIFAGTYSYGIYLIHNLVSHCLMPWAYINYAARLSPNQLTLMIAFLTLVITLPLALLMYRFVEKPALAFKDRVKLGPRVTVVTAEPIAGRG